MGTPRPPTLDRPLVAATTTLLMVGLLSLCACGGDDPAAPHQTAPHIVGSYQGSWTYILAYEPAGGDQDLVCPGTLTVDSQIPNGTFTGTWTQQHTSDDCNEASGTLAGIVEPSGAVTIVSLGSNGGGSGTTLEEVTGGECVSTRFDDAYRGSADGSSFEISYAISGDCGPNSAVSWVTAFSGVMTPSSSLAVPSAKGPRSVTRVLSRGFLCSKSQPCVLAAVRHPEQAPKRPDGAGVDTPNALW